MKKVDIYSTPGCGYCRMTKEFFQENNVEYTEYNVAADEQKRDEMIEKTGQMGVPVVMISNEGAPPEVIIGFDKARVTKLLGL